MHDVSIGNATPIKQHPYKYPPHKKNIIHEDVDYMLQIGVTESSDSPWSSPAVLADQEGKADRFCVIYRKPNSMLSPFHILKTV